MKRLHVSRGMWRVGIAVVGLGALFACASLVKREDRIKFSHKLHVVENELACADCHQAVMESEQVTPALRYREAQCLDCHDKAEGECGTCHTDPANPGTWAPRPASQGVVFSHALHLEVSEGKCTPCHAGVEQRTAPSQAARPMDHDTCMSCHRNDFKDIGCKTCHADLVENPSRPTKLFSHDADFMARHGNLAKTDEDVCAHCHRQEFCSDCHSKLEDFPIAVRLAERVDRQLVHRGDYLTRHPIDARTDPASCLKCHATRQCQACHDEARIAQGAARGDRASPHPAGWAMNVRSPDFHGDAARRDIVSCASCHDRGAASNCITCHKVGGTAGRSPHPGGWNPTAGRDTKMCKMCHGG
ncbi:MAG TPA: cytochrome c3 family protein [Myxococcota bacterium]|nr:cytochrome c3 family protein [Myxococcota bacterium]